MKWPPSAAAFTPFAQRHFFGIFAEKHREIYTMLIVYLHDADFDRLTYLNHIGGRSYVFGGHL